MISDSDFRSEFKLCHSSNRKLVCCQTNCSREDLLLFLSPKRYCREGEGQVFPILGEGKIESITALWEDEDVNQVTEKIRTTATINEERRRNSYSSWEESERKKSRPLIHPFIQFSSLHSFYFSFSPFLCLLARFFHWRGESNIECYNFCNQTREERKE